MVSRRGSRLPVTLLSNLEGIGLGDNAPCSRSFLLLIVFNQE